MKPADLLTLLLGIYSEKAVLRTRHEAGARAVGQFDLNNTYQYVLAREDVHLSWLAAAIESLGGRAPEAPAAPEIPSDQAAIIAADVEVQRAFLARWQANVERVSDARNHLMLSLMMGEMREQLRFFGQAASGRLDLLGRRTPGSSAVGSVLGTRWVE